MDNVFLEFDNSMLVRCSREIRGKLIIPDGVTDIGDDAFSGCSRLRSITLPDSIKSIGKEAFYGCERLMSINVSENNQHYSSQKGVVFNKDKTILIHCPENRKKKIYCVPDTVTHIGYGAFSGCRNLGTIVLQEGVTDIEECAFSGCRNLTVIIFPKSITYIGARAFENCSSLTEIEIPDGVKRIERRVFSGCRNLTDIIFPESVTCVGERAFENCSSLTEIEIPDGVKRIEGGVFSGCRNLTDIIFPESVTCVGERTFENCSSLTEIKLSDSIEVIERGAFFGCAGLVDITIPNGVKRIRQRAFSNCRNLAKITIPDSVERIGAGTFLHCPSLTSISVSVNNHYYISQDDCLYAREKNTLLCFPEGKEGEYDIPYGVKTIGDYAFAFCKSLTGVNIPESVECIGEGAFEDCENLGNITIPVSIKEIGANAFYGCSNMMSILFLGDKPVFNCHRFNHIKASVYYPSENKTWSESFFRNYGDEITWIPFNSRSEIENLEKWEMKKAGTAFLKICNHVLVGYSGIIRGDFEVPEGITGIGDRAFAYCRELTNIIIPKGVKTIGKEAFDYCDKLVGIEVPAGVGKIGEGAFYNCLSLMYIMLPDTVTYIGAHAFAGCSKLTTITLPNSVKRIEDAVFSDCRSLETIIVPDSVEEIGPWSFSNCVSLISISVSDNNLYYSSQDGCLFNKEKNVLICFPRGKGGEYTVPGSVTRIEQFAFCECFKLKGIIIPDSVTSIGRQAFFDCSGLEEIKIGNGVRCIEDYAFSRCNSLKEIMLPDSVNYIGEGIIYDCQGLVPANIPEKLMNPEEKLILSDDGFTPYDMDRNLRMRVSHNVFWGDAKPEKGKIIEIRVGFPFCCNVGEIFSVMYQKYEYVSAKLIKYWKVNSDTAYIWAEVTDTGYISSFIKPLTEEERKELENKGYADYWKSGYLTLTRIDDSMFVLHEYDQDYPEKLIFKTDSDGVDHLICHYYAGIFGEESYLGDYVVGLHRFCPYFQEEGAEVTQKNYSEEKVAEKEKEMETEMTEMEEDRIWKSDKRLNKKLWKNKYLRYRRSK